MEVILLEHVEKLGKMGDKVTVKNGYARNYLLPQNKALRATEANVAFYEKKKAELEAHNKALFDEASKKAEAFRLQCRSGSSGSRDRSAVRFCHHS